MTKNKSILIKNIYYMLSYAFQTLQQSVYKDLEVEEFDEIYDLFGAILSKGIGLQLKQGLYREYIGKSEEMSIMRGKVNIPLSLRNRISNKRTLTCDYDELSENNLFNQILKTTVFLLLKEKIKQGLKADLKKEMVYFSNVSALNPKMIQWSAIRFDKNNQRYRLLISICRLIIEGLLITTQNGQNRLSSFLDDQRMSKLYEKFILEYFRKNFNYLLYANAAKIKWDIDMSTNLSILPQMQSDVFLQKKKDNTVLIIDAKYYSNNMQQKFDKKTIWSDNLYQIFTYVKNCEYSFKSEKHSVSGMVLYAKTIADEQPEGVFVIHGNKIEVKILDLNKNFSEIRKQLDGIAEKYF